MFRTDVYCCRLSFKTEFSHVLFAAVGMFKADDTRDFRCGTFVAQQKLRVCHT